MLLLERRNLLCLLTLFVAGLVPFTTNLASAQSPLAQGPKPPETAEMSTIRGEDIEKAAATGAPYVLHVLGERFVVWLEPSGIRAKGFELSCASSVGLSTAQKSKTFKGTVDGEPSSIVRLSVCGDHVRGFIKSDTGWTFIEPARDVARFEHRVYTDVEIDEDFTGGCELVLASGETTTAQSIGTHDHPTTAAAEGDLLELEIAVVADYEFFEEHGEDSLAEIESVLNDVDGIYEAELGLSVEIVHATIWDEEEDPFESSDAGDLLYELKDQWVADNSAVERDLVHLFTGRNLDGSTIGIAFLSVVCSNSFGYGLSQDIGSAALLPLVVAHEIGHNLGSPHDEVGTEDKYIMYPALNGSTIDEFSDDSEDSISTFVDGINCLETLESGGVDNPSTETIVPPIVKDDDGGGPVDPLTVLLLGAGAYALRGRRRAQSCDPKA